MTVPASPPRTESAALAAWLARIERLHHRPIDMTLERVRPVAARLDLTLACPTIVVGGTNGKGSTCALLTSIARAAGYRVGTYTSPHLLHFAERAQIDGVPADDDALVAHFEAVEAARRDTSLTFFEFTTLAILRHLAQARLDLAVLEIGLGGRLDAVNLVDADCAIVTAIDIDHVEYLGDTREKIGFEKAHIYRPGRPAICSDPAPPRSLVDYAERIGADFWRFGRDFNYQGQSDGRTWLQWSYGGRAQRRSGLPYPALRGINQLLNASGALAAFEALAERLPLAQQAVRQGLLNVDLPARFQVLPGRPSIVLDVAHNPQAAAVLARNLDQQGFFPQTHAVFSALRDKDIGGIVAAVVDRIDHWYVAPTLGARSTAADVLQAELAAHGAHAIRVFETVARARAAALEAAHADDRILIFGSFLTVAEAMRAGLAGGS